MHIARAATLASGILFPLYIFPKLRFEDTECTGWTPVLNAIASHPDLPFISVINIDSGPGASSLPDPAYQLCIPQLKADNTRVIAYVHTLRGASPTEEVEANITAYANWEVAYRPEGVFFDEAATADDPEIIEQLRDEAEFARNAFADFIILNPGTTPQSDEYFGFADLIVTAENTYSAFNLADFSSHVTPTAPASKQAVVLHDAPVSDAPYTSLLTQLVDTSAGGLGIADVFITEVEYTSVSVNWEAFVEAVEAATS